MNFNDLRQNTQTCKNLYQVYDSLQIYVSNYFLHLDSQSTNVLMINHKISNIKNIMLGHIITFWKSGPSWKFSCSTDIISEIVFLSKVFVINTFIPLIFYYHKKIIIIYFRGCLNLYDLRSGSFIWLSFSLSEWLLFSFHDKKNGTILLCSTVEQEEPRQSK